MLFRSSSTHHPWSSALFLAPCLCVGHPPACVSHPGKRGCKLIGALRLIGHTYSLRLRRDKAAIAGVCKERLHQTGMHSPGGSLSQCPRRQGPAVGEGNCIGSPAPCASLNNGTSFPRQTMFPIEASHRGPHSHPLRLSLHSQHQSSPWIFPPNPTL